MLAVVWEFRVRDGCTEEFERLYGPDGEWSKLFREGEGWRGTELWRDESLPRRYITLDRWESAEAYRQFKRDFRQAYEALDARCQALSESEKKIGEFVGLE